MLKSVFSLVKYEVACPRKISAETVKKQTKGISSCLKDLKADTQKKTFVFIDEIQYLDNPSSFLKYLHGHYKPRLKFIVTGSSSMEIKKKLMTNPRLKSGFCHYLRCGIIGKK